MGGIEDFDIEVHAIGHIGCPYCSRPAGHGCVTKSGRPCRAHSNRVWPFQEAWSIGYEYGWSTAVQFHLSEPDRFDQVAKRSAK